MPESPLGSPPDPPSPPHWTPARQRVLEWLKREVPPLGELYETALDLMHESRGPGWERLVCHAMREIGNGVPEKIVGRDVGITPLTNRLDEIVSAWKTSGLPLDGANSLIPMGDAPHPSVAVPLSVIGPVADLVRERATKSQSRLDVTAEFILRLAGDDEDARARLRPIITIWGKAVRWFISHVHVSVRQANSQVDRAVLRSHVETLEGVLSALVLEFFQTTAEIDEILEKANE